MRGDDAADIQQRRQQVMRQGKLIVCLVLAVGVDYHADTLFLGYREFQYLFHVYHPIFIVDFIITLRM